MLNPLLASSKKELPFLLFTLSIAFALTLPVLIQDGMFCDAYLYTSVAKNLAHGEGSFWFPYFDEMNVAGLPSFHEQPPLVFWLESLFFTVFGDSLYTERIYTVVMLLLNMFLLRIIWQRILPDRKEQYWLVILCWITIPVCFWSYSNCMHENTMSVFCLSSIAASCQYYYRYPKRKVWLLLSSVFIVLAFLSKGLPGLYPLAFPFCFFLIRERSFKYMLQDTLFLLAIPIGFALYVYFDPTAHQSLIENYMIKRLFQRVGHAPTVSHRWDTLWRLFTELIPLLLLTLVLFFFTKKRQQEHLFYADGKKVLLFFFLGFCGTLPLMLTSVQKGFYMVAALPCFGIGFALWHSAFFYSITQGIPEKGRRILTRIAAVCVILSLLITLSFIGKTSRDADILHDVYAIGKVVPYNTYFELENKQFEDWSFQNYMMRYPHLAVCLRQSNYMVAEKNRVLQHPERYERIPIETRKYDFYKLKH